VVDVDIEDSFEQSGPTHARRRALRVRVIACGLGCLLYRTRNNFTAQLCVRRQHAMDAAAYAIALLPRTFQSRWKDSQQDPSVATGAGHHSVLHAPGSNKWYIVYHRRPLGETDRNHRVVCIDEMRFDKQGLITPAITKDGVPRDVPRY
jgi:hypothetical protein